MPIRKTFDHPKYDDFSYDSLDDTQKVIEAAQHYNFMLHAKNKQKTNEINNIQTKRKN